MLKEKNETEEKCVCSKRADGHRLQPMPTYDESPGEPINIHSIPNNGSPKAKLEGQNTSRGHDVDGRRGKKWMESGNAVGQRMMR